MALNMSWESHKSERTVLRGYENIIHMSGSRIFSLYFRRGMSAGIPHFLFFKKNVRLILQFPLLFLSIQYFKTKDQDLRTTYDPKAWIAYLVLCFFRQKSGHFLGGPIGQAEEHCSWKAEVQNNSKDSKRLTSGMQGSEVLFSYRDLTLCVCILALQKFLLSSILAILITPPNERHKSWAFGEDLFGNKQGISLLSQLFFKNFNGSTISCVYL